MFVKYKLDYRKQDSIGGIGLVWQPGQVRNVSQEAAAKLLAYSDTWEQAEYSTVEAENAPEVGLTQEEKPAEEPLPVIDFLAMDKKALVEFAQTKYNEKLDKRQTEETIRHRVIALFSQHEMDEG